MFPVKLDPSDRQLLERWIKVQEDRLAHDKAREKSYMLAFSSLVEHVLTLCFPDRK